VQLTIHLHFYLQVNFSECHKQRKTSIAASLRCKLLRVCVPGSSTLECSYAICNMNCRCTIRSIDDAIRASVDFFLHLDIVGLTVWIHVCNGLVRVKGDVPFHQTTTAISSDFPCLFCSQCTNVSYSFFAGPSHSFMATMIRTSWVSADVVRGSDLNSSTPTRIKKLRSHNGGRVICTDSRPYSTPLNYFLNTVLQTKTLSTVMNVCIYS
jgi:hypothetical protein